MKNTKTNGKVDLFIVSAGLAVIGIGLASYLLYEYLFPPAISPCYVNATINCEASTRGVLANTLGIPTAVYGLVGYIVILIAGVKRWPKLLLGISAFGLLFCLRITFLEIFVIKIICPVCLACQLNMIILFLLGLKINTGVKK